MKMTAELKGGPFVMEKMAKPKWGTLCDGLVYQSQWGTLCDGIVYETQGETLCDRNDW